MFDAKRIVFSSLRHDTPTHIYIRYAEKSAVAKSCNIFTRDARVRWDKHYERIRRYLSLRIHFMLMTIECVCWKITAHFQVVDINIKYTDLLGQEK